MEFFDLQSEIVAYKNIALSRILASFYKKNKRKILFTFLLEWDSNHGPQAWDPWSLPTELSLQVVKILFRVYNILLL